MNNAGHNLIFLISQPRAGSTLTQRILGAHPLIHTQSEPWILLHPLHAMKPANLISCYNSDIYNLGLNDFIVNMPGGMNRYKETIASAFGSFYEAILEQKEKRFFLDKTPRYYHILDELSEFYPEAKFIFLWRNPVAVLSSIINSWSKENWYTLSDYKYDLLDAPALMLSGQEKLRDNALIIKYEDLLIDPKNQMESICKYIGIPFENGMLQYGNEQSLKYKFGDKGNAFEKSLPDLLHAEQWKNGLENPQTWRVMNDYLGNLGNSVVTKMGYSFEQILRTLKENKPNIDIEKHTVPFSVLLNNTKDSFIENRMLKTQLQQKQNEFAQTKEEIEKKREQVELKDGDIKKQNEKIYQLLNRLEYKEEQKKLMDEEIKTRNDEIQQLIIQLEKRMEQTELKNEEIHQLLNQLKQKNEQLNNYSETINQLHDQLNFSNEQLSQTDDKAV